METWRVPGALDTWLLIKKLLIDPWLQQVWSEMDPPLWPQVPSSYGTVPEFHPKGGPPVPLKLVVTEHCWVGLH
jgi:hypothetical protein